MGKSPDAFRTISEVAEWLDTPAHVLRFWESKFPQIKPVKRAGGRRYYRPADMQLIGGIKKLLHDDGMTIKGARKVLHEQGVRYVAGMSQPLDDAEEGEITAARIVEPAATPAAAPVEQPAPDISAPAAEAPVSPPQSPAPEVVTEGITPAPAPLAANVPADPDEYALPTTAGPLSALAAPGTRLAAGKRTNAQDALHALAALKARLENNA